MKFQNYDCNETKIKTELHNYIIFSLEKVYKNDYSLIERKANERSIVFRFALYFNELIKNHYFLTNFNLDLEYNRNMNNPKSTSKSLYGTYPDLILHKRESNDNNLLIIEFKKKNNNMNNQNDIKKLEDFTCQSGDYKYLTGYYIELNINSFLYRIFNNGKEIEQKEIKQ